MHILLATLTAITTKMKIINPIKLRMNFKILFNSIHK